MKLPETAIFMSVHLEAKLKLEEINETVALCEQAVGPLSSMKFDNDLSLFRFAATEPRPTKFATIIRQADAGDKTVVTTGRIFVEGEQVLCAAVRSK